MYQGKGDPLDWFPEQVGTLSGPIDIVVVEADIFEVAPSIVSFTALIRKMQERAKADAARLALTTREADEALKASQATDNPTP